jgi:hypothetical protein
METPAIHGTATTMHEAGPGDDEDMLAGMPSWVMFTIASSGAGHVTDRFFFFV